MADDQALQQQVQQFQALSQQLQAASQQRQQFEALKSESEHALKTLGDLDDDATVYRNIGSLLVKDKGKEAAIARITDDLETLEVRAKRVREQEKELQGTLEKLQQQLQEAFAKQQG